MPRDGWLGAIAQLTLRQSGPDAERTQHIATKVPANHPAILSDACRLPTIAGSLSAAFSVLGSPVDLSVIIEVVEAAPPRRSVAAWTTSWSQMQIAESDQMLVKRAAKLAQEFALRGYDAVHAASAESVNGDRGLARTRHQHLRDQRELIARRPYLSVC